MSTNTTGFPSFISKFMLTACTNILQKNSGRANLFKVLQYLTKTMAVHLKDSDPKNVWVGNFNHASNTINTARKMLTLGGWIDTLEQSRSVMAKTPCDIFRKLSNYCNAIYLLFDNVVFLQRIKITQLLGEKAAKTAMFAFFMSQLFALIADLITISELTSRERTQPLDNNLASIRALRKTSRERQWLYATVLMRLGNMIYSSNGFDLGLNLVGSNFSERSVAWSGLIAGLIALAQGAEKSINETRELYKGQY